MKMTLHNTTLMLIGIGISMGLMWSTLSVFIGALK